MHSEDKPLFYKATFHAVIESRKREISNSVEAISEQRLVGEDAAALVQELTSQFSVNIPVLDEAEITASPPREVTLEQRARDYDFNGSSRQVKGTSVTFNVPYSGDKEAFHVRPSASTLPPPSATVLQGAIQISFVGTNLNPAQVKSEFEYTLREIKKHLDTLRTDFSAFDGQVQGLVQSAISTRTQRVKQRTDFAANLGYKIK